jgi:CxxC-x17-CxxC domain-containing protein
MGNFFNERKSGRRGGGRSERPTMHKAVCDKCGKDCEVPFKPSGDKPIYCSRCFENVDPKKRDYKKTSTTSIDISPLKDQLSSINTKLDVLIEILNSKKKVVSKKTKKD